MIRQTVATPGASAGAAARQAHAAELLFARYRDQIYRFCFARLRSREGAEDATQDVFMRVHMALKRGVVPEYEAAWLYKIAHNVCLSKGESTARRARLETPHAFDDEDFPVAAREVSHDELAGLSEALAAMPAKMRKAILLREWQGLSYAEIAEAMGLTVSAVETLLFRARRELATALEQGPPAQKRRLGGLFPLPGFLRRLLGGLAPAKLATGAALVALTGGGVGLGLSIASAPAAHVPHASIPAGAGPVSYLAGVGGPAAFHHARAISVSVPAPVRRPGDVGSGAAVASAATATREPGIAAVVPSFTPAAEPRPSEPIAPVPTTPTTTVSASTPVGTTTVSVPTVQAPSLPAVAPPDTPTVSVPAVTVPTVDVTTVSDPASSLPVSVPVVTLP